jgi:signal peptidase I
LGFGALALLGALLLAAMARRARLEPMLVHGESMLPTLPPGQRIAVGPAPGLPRRGDVVVVRRPEREVVKRVVGLPGERVRLVGGRLEIDGRPVPEPYAVAHPALDATGLPDPGAPAVAEDSDGAVELDLRLGADELAVLGDCRDRSTDSRSFGPVRRNDLIAIVRFTYWPPRRMRPPK